MKKGFLYVRLTDQLLFKIKFSKICSEPNENISAIWGYTQATLRLHSGYTQATLRLHSGYTQATLRLHSGYTQATLRNYFSMAKCSLLDSFLNDLLIGLVANRQHTIF